MLVKIHVLSPSVVSSSFATPLTVAHQDPLSMESSRQEKWSDLPFPNPGNLPDSSSKSHLLHLLHWQVDSLLLSHDRVNSIKIQQS